MNFEAQSALSERDPQRWIEPVQPDPRCEECFSWSAIAYICEVAPDVYDAYMRDGTIERGFNWQIRDACFLQ